jgi:hypothetical protein
LQKYRQCRELYNIIERHMEKKQHSMRVGGFS